MTDSTNDEIDLLELMRIIWDGKWVIATVCVLFGLLAFIGDRMLPPSYQGEFAVRTLNPQQMSAYAPLNNVPRISTPIYSGSNLIGQTGVILSKDLFNQFTEEFTSKKQLREAIKKHDPAYSALQGSEFERADALNRITEDYQLEQPRDNLETLILKITTTNQKATREILAITIKNITNDIRHANLVAITNLKQSISSSLAFEIERLETKIANALDDYYISTKARLAFLGEQAAIARQLNIVENSLDFIPQGSNGNIGITVNDDTPFYLRGYKAIEMEISLIKQRNQDDVSAFVGPYAGLVAELRALRSDKRLQRIDKGLELTPLVDPENFQAASFEIASLFFEPKRNSVLIIILITMLGGGLAVLGVLLRHYVLKADAAA